MAVKTMGVLNNLTADTQRGPSPSIWNANSSKNGWVADFIQNPLLGHIFIEDFQNCGLSPATGSATTFSADQNWYAYADTAGAIADGNIQGGAANFAGGTTDDAGVAIGSLTGNFQLVAVAAMQGMMTFETRVSMSTAAIGNTTVDAFIGLVDVSGKPAAAMPITATNGLLSTTPGLIGFHKRGGTTNASDWNFVYQVAAGTAVYATNLQNLILTVTGAAMATGFYKLGFIFNPFAESVAIVSASTGQTAGVLARPIIKVFVNGIPAAAFLTTTNVLGAAFPLTMLAPMVAFRMGATTASMSMNVDWVYCAQEFIA